MKRTELEKLQATKVVSEMRRLAPADRYGQGSNAMLDRREQRRLDRERGLVPFAVKLDGTIVQRLHALAAERKLGMNELVDELLRKSLEANS